jgi:glutathione peroxidase
MASSLENIAVRSIDDQPSSLGNFAGTVRLVVNVASRCGNTPQYKALEALYRKYQDRGFRVLGFPANDFGAQEPGTDAEIQQFCSLNYDVTFPMFAKLAVKGPEQHPLYAALTAANPEAKGLPGTDYRAKLASYGIEPGAQKDVLWNFEKFLVNRKGEVVERFSPDVPPDSEMIVKAIERELEAS